MYYSPTNYSLIIQFVEPIVNIFVYFMLIVLIGSIIFTIAQIFHFISQPIILSAIVNSINLI